LTVTDTQTIRKNSI